MNKEILSEAHTRLELDQMAEAMKRQEAENKARATEETKFIKPGHAWTCNFCSRKNPTHTTVCRCMTDSAYRKEMIR